MRVYFHTLGCKVNQYETQCMRELFEKKGYTVAQDGESFDIAVINSCTVTAESDRKTRQLLNRLRRENPSAVIVLTGCMAQTFKGEKQELNSADLVIGNTDIEKIIEYTEKFLSTKEKQIVNFSHDRYECFNTPSISDFAERTRAYMKIEDGCDRYCTYCIIPFARGFVRSKSCDLILKEAEALAQKGFIEVVLVGINLSSYGKGENINLCDAVDAAAKPDGIKRVRLGSIEPDLITDEMLARLKQNSKFCPQFHLSLQSGCDKTLKRMNRHYDTAFYRDLVKSIRAAFPNAGITTDIMVGFAGESEEDFCESVDFLKEIGFSKAHVFAYSRRKGTLADKMPGQITRQEKARRSKIMIDTANLCESEFMRSQVGRVEEVLFEIFENGFAEGYTKSYVRVAVETEKPLLGKIQQVKITKAFNDKVLGELI